MKPDVSNKLLESLIAEANNFRTTRYSGFSYLQRGYDKELTEEEAPLFQLYAGLGVIVRDYNEYIHNLDSDDKDVILFNKLFSRIINENKKHYPNTSIFVPGPSDHLPEGFAASAAKGNPILTGLGDWRIVHEKTTKPGKGFFIVLLDNFREVICGEDGPYEFFRDEKIIDNDKLKKVLMGCIASSGVFPTTFWYPLAVYSIVLMSKIVIKTYCETGKIQVRHA